MIDISLDSDFEDLIDLLMKADDAYYNSSEPELMTDSEYDRLKKKAFAQNPSHPYFSRVGSDVRGGKIKLPYTMGSLDQVYEGEIQSWFNKYKLIGKNIVITDKLDGISCMLVYRNGELEIAYSRGNGVEGADITRHIKLVKSIPAKLKDDSYTVIRGELIMKNDTFKQNWANKFKNPRVMVAGTMNRGESVAEQIADIDFVAYEIVATSATMERTKVEQILRLKAHGFNVVPYEMIAASEKIDDAFLTNFLREVRLASPYELDGIVITANDIEAAQGQRNSVSLNPEHSCKYKVNDESSEIEATVVNVLWEISKNGLLKPRIQIMPVELFGTTVTYATGFNGKFVRDNGIGTGAKIRITKSGTVIPYIVEVIKPAIRTSLPSEDEFGKWGWNETDVEIVLENADDNPKVKLKQVLDFVEKLNVELLKESSLTKLFDAFNLWSESYENIIYTIIDLKQREWEMAIGSNGVKSYMSLHRRLQNVELATLLGAAKFMGVGFGVRKAKALIFGAPNGDVWSLTANDIAMMDGFDVKTASQIAAGLKKTKKFVDTLINSGYVKLVSVTKTDELKDVQVVMTGFRDADLSAEIEKRGGKIGSGVSKKTTYLLTFDTNSNSGKAKKARELGITIMTPDEFKDKYNL